jgi:hypothetical protein
VSRVDLEAREPRDAVAWGDERQPYKKKILHPYRSLQTDESFLFHLNSESWTGEMSESASQQPIALPGFGKPLQHLPQWRFGDKPPQRFPHAIADHFASDGVTVRERRMLEFISQITDKPDWERKVFDESIVEKWREEACVHHEDLEDVFLSSRMFHYVRLFISSKSNRAIVA